MTPNTLLGSLTLMTVACAPAPPAAEGAEPQIPVHGETGFTCKADAARSLIGKASSSELGAEALRLTGARTIRWIRIGDAVTMDYRTDRLNIHLDGRGRVERIDCG